LADIRREEDRTMSNFSKRAVRWAAPVALVGAVGLVACGDGDDETTRTAAPKAAVSGSENRPAYVRWTSRFGVHLEIPAEEIAQLVAHRERADRAAAARLAAQADQYERLAHREGQAKTYGGTEVPTNSDANLPNAFEAGNRAANKAQAERYVESLEDRATANSSGTSNRAAQKAQAEPYVEWLESLAEARAAAARLAAQADQYERLAHLEGQAKTYGGIEAGHLAWAWDQIAQAE
jgi:hypothetical protein